MKTQITITCLAVLTLSLHAFGATLMQENFESYSFGSWPAPWVGDANANSSPANNIIIQDPQYPENKVLKLFGSLGGCWGALAYYPNVFPSEFYVQCRVYNGSDVLSGCHPHRAYIGMRHGTYWYAGTNPARILMSFMGDGHIYASDGTVLGNYLTERWYDIQIHYSLIDNDLTLKYWIDGSYITSITIQGVDLLVEASLDHLELTVQEGGAYYDDVAVFVANDNKNKNKVAIVNPDHHRILKHGIMDFYGGSEHNCDSYKYFSIAYGEVPESCDYHDPSCWAEVGIQEDYLGKILEDAGFGVDYYETNDFPAVLASDYGTVIIQDPLRDNMKQFSSSDVEQGINLLQHIVSPEFSSKIRQYTNSGGQLVLVGDAVRFLGNGYGLLNYNKTIVTDVVGNAVQQPSCKIPDNWFFIRGNPFCGLDRRGFGQSVVESSDLVPSGTVFSDITISNLNDLAWAEIWSETVFYPTDGISLLDIHMSCEGEYVLDGSVCNPPIYTVTVEDTLQHMVGITKYNDQDIYYIGSDSFFDFKYRNNVGAWHAGQYSEIQYTITETGKMAILKLLNGIPKVLTPNGGESFVAGQPNLITWEQESNVTNVCLEYSFDNGQTWHTIDPNSPNDGVYEWSTPKITSNQCLIKISAADNPFIYDISDNTFVIYECLYQSPADINKDCYVNLSDLAELAIQWLNCGNPLDGNCTKSTLEHGLIAYFSFNEGAGSLLHDLSGNNYDAVINGASWTEGIKGTGLNFDGSDFISIPFGLNYEFTDGLTIQAWIKTSDSTDASGIVAARGPGDGPTANFHALGTGSQEQTPAFTLTGTSAYGINGTAPVNDGVWHHLVGTYNNKEMAVYLDGVKYSTPCSGVVTTLANFEIGRDNTKPWEAGRWYEGVIDEVRIYNRGLTNVEVENLYLEHSLALGLIAHYKLDEKTGSVIDEVGNYDGVNCGATKDDGIVADAYKFDGIDTRLDTIPQPNIPSIITVSMWVYPTRESDSMQIWGSVDNASGGKDGYVANYSSENESVVFAYVSDNIDRGEVITPNNTVPLNSWSYLTYTVDSMNQVKIYVNGQEKGSGSFTVAPLSHDRALMIGKSILSQHLAFEGKIDEVRIYEYALNEVVIQSLYTNP